MPTRCVIVDDEAPARERLRHLLVGADVEGLEIVGEAADGQEAIASIERLSPDLVFLDIQMPVLTGLQVAARLPLPKPRVIFCTAFDQFAIEAFELHAVDYLLKPVNRERLSRTVARVSRDIAEDRRRLRDRLEAATTQARLMPAAATVSPGLEWAGRSVPADGVGGDYYDVLALRDGAVAVALGDISGKGVYAGLLAAALQARMQTLTSHGPCTPAAVLSELNRLTRGTIEDHRFATVFFGAFDPKRQTLTYANAGHPPALLLSSGGTVRRLEANGPVVGWIGDGRFEDATLALAPGDTLAVYSDGVTETLAADGTELGTDGLSAILRRHAALDATSMVEATLADVAAYANGAPAADDRTLLIAKVL
jgi:serine phosphatase RsbU (regulator of sigma subunit)